MPFYFMFDYTYILAIIAAVISLIASAGVKMTFNKYSKRIAQSGLTGRDVATRILNGAGIYDVSVNHIAGNLTDNFNPTNKTLNLSDSVYASNSIVAIGVAAHESGHAIQHDKGYVPIKIRGAIVPVVNFGSRLSFPVILLGCLMNYNEIIISIGILLFSFGLIFSLITLPVEFNASRRAISILEQDGILYDEELRGARKVLFAAAMTYVASAIGMALQLLRLFLMFKGGRRRR
ncbi:MAG: zinc metallopeptidase [Oscillospiraceae bacterium]|nr:zinc metallopeptidase [Oscillospiraceae bacterium]